MYKTVVLPSLCTRQWFCLLCVQDSGFAFFVYKTVVLPSLCTRQWFCLLCVQDSGFAFFVYKTVVLPSLCTRQWFCLLCVQDSGFAFFVYKTVVLPSLCTRQWFCVVSANFNLKALSAWLESFAKLVNQLTKLRILDFVCTLFPHLLVFSKSITFTTSCLHKFQRVACFDYQMPPQVPACCLLLLPDASTSSSVLLAFTTRCLHKFQRVACFYYQMPPQVPARCLL